jgi:uncharacterized repeat protein (TIGR03803 family)
VGGIDAERRHALRRDGEWRQSLRRDVIQGEDQRHRFRGAETLFDGRRRVSTHTPPIVSGNTLYGVAFAGGAARDGVLFKVQTDGSRYTVYKSLDSASGFYSYARLQLQGSTIYGTTDYGGSHGNGVIFAFDIPPELYSPELVAGAFAFSVSGISNQTVVIEANTNLANSSWVPLQTNMLGDAPFHFIDPTTAAYPTRFYRARAP